MPALEGAILIIMVHIGKYKGIKLATNANSYLINTNVTSTVDQFLTTFTSRTKIEHNSSGGFGGSSSHGGSTISHGSSGSSHGGGGHHF